MPNERRDERLRVVAVWDLPTRVLHWISALTVLVLIGVGLIVMNLGALGIRPPASLHFKEIHVWAGYVLTLSICARLAWACFGSTSAGWRELMPGGKGYWRSLGAEFRAFVSGRVKAHVGHSAGGRLAIAIMLALLVIMTVTGLVLAGTDIYYPPFGRYFAQWVAAPGVDPATVVPYEPELVRLAAFKEVREFRRPFIVAHQWAFYGLAAMVVIHVAAVVRLEICGGGSLMSAMITGKKTVPDLAGDSEPEARTKHIAAGAAQ